MLQEVLVQEQMGRVTNALGWVAATPPSWLPPIATPYQIEQFVRPAIAGQREECYAITEEGAGLPTSPAGCRGDGDAGGEAARADYLLNGVKWHVTSFNTADYAFFQGVLADGPHAGEHAMFLVDLPSPGVTVRPHPGVLAHDQPPPPDRRVRRRPGARQPPDRRRGRRDDLRLRVVPLRAADGRPPAAWARPSG